MHEAPPPSGVPALLANHRPPHPAETRSPPRARQLCHPQACHPQACQGDGMARQAPALSPALHPDLGIVAQPSRALLRLDHSSPHPARCLHLGARTRSGHPRLPRPSQCPPQALRLDKIGRGNPCQSQPRASHPGNRRERESSDKLSTLGCPISRSLTTFCVCLEPRPLPSTGVTRLHWYCGPLRHPSAPGLSLTGVRLIIPDHALGLPVLRALSLCTCCRHYPGAAAGRRPRSSHPAVSAFPDNVVGSACTSSFSRIAQRIAVGTPIAGRPPHRSGRARFRHPAPTSGV